MASQKNRLPDCESHPNLPVSMVCLFPNCEKPLFCGSCLRGGINVTHMQHMNFVFSTQELIEMNSDCQKDIYESFVGKKQTFSQDTIDDLFRGLEAEIAEKLSAAKKQVLERFEKRNSAIEIINNFLQDLSSKLKAVENERVCKYQEMRGLISELGQKIAATNEMSTQVSFCEDEFRRVKREILNLFEKDLFESSLVEGTKEQILVRQEMQRFISQPPHGPGGLFGPSPFQSDFKLLQWNELDKPLRVYLQFDLLKLPDHSKFTLTQCKRPTASVLISSNFLSSKTYLCEFQFDLEAIKYCALNPIDVKSQQQGSKQSTYTSGLFGQQPRGLFDQLQSQAGAQLFGNLSQGGLFGDQPQVPNKSPYEDIEMMRKDMFDARSEYRSENEEPNVDFSADMIIQIFQVDEKGVETLLFNSDSIRKDDYTPVKFPQIVKLRISPYNFTCKGSWLALGRKLASKIRKINTPTFQIKAQIQIINTSSSQISSNQQGQKTVTTLQPILSVNYIRKL